MDRATFGAELRRLRIEGRLTLRDLADLTHHSKTSLGDWENGAKLPSPEAARLLDTKLGGGVLIKLHRLAAKSERHRQLSRESSRLCDQLAALAAGEMTSLVARKPTPCR